ANKLNTSGTALIYSAYLAGTEADQLESIAVHPTDSVHVVGRTATKNFPLTNDAVQAQLRGGQNGFVTKLNPAGTSSLFSGLPSGRGGSDLNKYVAADSASSSYVMGYTKLTNRAFQRSPSGSGDVFATKIDYSQTAAAAASDFRI